MAGNPMEEVAKRMQGLKDSRSTVGELSRGKNMYPGGNAAHSGPGGPDMGRPPTAVPQQAADAVRQKTMMADQMGAMQAQRQDATQAKQRGLQRAAQNPMAAQMNPNLQQLQNRIAPQKSQALGAQTKKLGEIAKKALQAAAQRKMQRGR